MYQTDLLLTNIIMTTKKTCTEECKENLKILVDSICNVKDDVEDLEEFVSELDEYIEQLEDRTDDVEEMENINSDRLCNLEDATLSLNTSNRIIWMIALTALVASIVAICN